MAHRWQEILDVLALGEMPPEDESQPAPAKRIAATEHIRAMLAGAAPRLEGQSETVVMRRLNRVEYRNTMRELFGFVSPLYDPARHLPADEEDDGFFTIGETLMTSPLWLEGALAAAEESIDCAMAMGGVKPEPISLSYSAASFRPGRTHVKPEKKHGCISLYGRLAATATGISTHHTEGVPAAGWYASRGDKHGYNRPYAASNRPDEAFTDHQIADEALKAIGELKGGPFFLAVGFIRPHTPWVAPQWAFDAIDRNAIHLPPFYRDEGEDVSNLPKASLRPNNNAFRYEQPTRAQALDAQHAYLAAVHFVDHQIGRLMAELDRSGLKESTIIALTGDHGYQLGEHGLWAKQTLFEGGNHVPLIFAGSSIKPGISQALVEQVDIYPTLCELAGLPIPDQVQGVSLVPWLEEPSRKSRIAAFSTMTAPLGRGQQAMGHSVRNGRFRYIEWDNGKSGVMLYDLINDPGELNNLVDTPEHQPMQRRLKRLLAEHLRRVE